MSKKFLGEFLGTFFFTSVIIVSVEGFSDKIVEKSHAYLRIGLALAVAIILVGGISGGHLNPAVSFMFWLNQDLNAPHLAMYVIAQLLGASASFLFYKYLYLKN